MRKSQRIQRTERNLRGVDRIRGNPKKFGGIRGNLKESHRIPKNPKSKLSIQENPKIILKKPKECAKKKNERILMREFNQNPKEYENNTRD